MTARVTGTGNGASMAADSATATASTHQAGASAAARTTRATPAGGHGSPRLTGWWPRTRYRASVAATAMPHSRAMANPAGPIRCSCADQAAKAGTAPKLTVSARVSKPWPNADAVPVWRATGPVGQVGDHGRAGQRGRFPQGAVGDDGQPGRKPGRKPGQREPVGRAAHVREVGRGLVASGSRRGDGHGRAPLWRGSPALAMGVRFGLLHTGCGTDQRADPRPTG